MILGRELRAQAHVAPEVARVTGRGQYLIHERRQPEAAVLACFEKPERIGRRTPVLDIGCVQVQCRRDLSRGHPGRLGERLEQPEPHPEIDQVHRVEPAPPLENPRHLSFCRRRVARTLVAVT